MAADDAKKTISSNTFKHHGPKAPIINSGCIKAYSQRALGALKEKKNALNINTVREKLLGGFELLHFNSKK